MTFPTHGSEFHDPIAWKTPVRAASTANGTLATAYENGDTLDGVTLATGDRILLKNQTAGAENGIYLVAASGTPTRAADFNSQAEILGGVVLVRQGTTNADTAWMCTNDPTITVGTTALVFAAFGGGGGGSALTVEEVDGSPTDAAVTKIVFPNGTLGIASHVATYTPAAGTTAFIGVSLQRQTTQGSLAAATYNSIQFTTEDFDSDGFHESVTNPSRVTIPAGLAGKYLLSGSCAVNQTFSTGFKKNGTAVSAATGQASASAVQDNQYVLDLAVGDYVELYEYHSSGTGTVAAAGVDDYPRFQVVKLSGSTDPASLLPWHVFIPCTASTPDATTGTWILGTSSTQATFPFYAPGSTANSGTAVVFQNGTGTAINDAAAWDVVLAAGTWDAHFWVRKHTAAAIITLQQDGSDMGTVDTYDSGALAAKVSITGWTVSTTGKKRMNLKAATKHASSTNYFISLFAIEFRRTA